MAMTQCAECGYDISDQADHCVSCGAPVVRKSRRSRYLINLVIGIVLALVGVAMMLYTGDVGIYLHGPGAGISLPPGLVLIGLLWMLGTGIAAGLRTR